MKKVTTLLVVSLIGVVGWAQTCTISCPGAPPCTINWVNSVTCPNGGTLVISAGVTLNFDSNGDTWTGSEIIVFGTLRQSFNGGNTINANITVKNGGKVEVLEQLSLGSNSADCNYTITVDAGGILTVPGGPGADDKLRICGTEVIRSGPPAGCNVYDPNAVPPTPTPYCNPPGGFAGPIDFDKNGVQPVELIYFNAAKSGTAIKLNWATSMEEDFSHFVIQHAVNGFDYTDLDEVEGVGYNTESQNDYEYTHTLPLIGYNYYRLKAIDLNGSFEYFGPVVERFTGNRAVWIHPNPVTSDRVAYKINFTPNEGDRIQVYNGMGQVVADVPASQNAGIIYFASAVQSGSYILKYNSATSSYYARFIVLK